ncbi:N-acetylmuramidase domain-containing protein [Rhizobium halophytocola]|uniref:DUF3380 domain-containing protein n=1 Tax=Rhizobium halophytocola TaxID=735519 RepID=A0ABS4E2F6_9HYPH|nr:N-acetylmuramidase domain-containing protein [Rhizobium halophytocola]MBP1852103.1 hypothetical protein [Rhizobium halophytocola]
MNFVGTGRTLSGEDFARAATLIGCEEAAIRAVTVVEARGQGFDAKNRPVILPEPHVLYRNLKGEERARAVNAGLAWSSWQPGRYPATQDARYDQLGRMTAINLEAGLKAPSWGIGQVLGENAELCGFKSAQALVEKCMESEGGQLDVMVGFIVGKGLGSKLRRKDWAGFAHGYNGAAYAKNQYDLKLDRAYRRLAIGASAAYDPLADGLLSVGDKGDVVKVLQIAIGAHADGDFGPMTAQKVRDFQREHGLVVDGKVGKQTGRMLNLDYWS